MSKSAFEVAREALTVLEFYSDSYASSGAYVMQRDEVVEALKGKARNYPDGTVGRALLNNLATALVQK